MNEHLLAEATNAMTLRIVKLLLKHDVAQSTILAAIEEIEAMNTEAQEHSREVARVFPRHLYQNA